MIRDDICDHWYSWSSFGVDIGRCRVRWMDLARLNCASSRSFPSVRLSCDHGGVPRELVKVVGDNQSIRTGRSFDSGDGVNPLSASLVCFAFPVAFIAIHFCLVRNWVERMRTFAEEGWGSVDLELLRILYGMKQDIHLSATDSKWLLVLWQCFLLECCALPCW